MSVPAAKNSNRSATVPPASVPVEDQIRLRAYELYEERGREDGRDIDDWLRAEAEVVRKRSRIHAA